MANNEGSVKALLASVGLRRYERNLELHGISDVQTLCSLNEKELLVLGLPLGPRRKLSNVKAILEARRNDDDDDDEGRAGTLEIGVADTTTTTAAAAAAAAMDEYTISVAEARVNAEAIVTAQRAAARTNLAARRKAPETKQQHKQQVETHSMGASARSGPARTTKSTRAATKRTATSQESTHKLLKQSRIAPVTGRSKFVDEGLEVEGDGIGRRGGSSSHALTTSSGRRPKTSRLADVNVCGADSEKEEATACKIAELRRANERRVIENIIGIHDRATTLMDASTPRPPVRTIADSRPMSLFRLAGASYVDDNEMSTAMPPCVVNPSQTTTTTVDMLERLFDSLEEGDAEQDTEQEKEGDGGELTST